jgi:hypothetical protein
MWFILRSIALFYDIFGQSILLVVTGGIGPEIVNPFIFAGLVFVFVTNGIKGWAWPLLKHFIIEMIPIINLAPGFYGFVTEVYEKESELKAREENEELELNKEELELSKEELVAQQIAQQEEAQQQEELVAQQQEQTEDELQPA